jgi:acetoacetyl-CoA synthetase
MSLLWQPTPEAIHNSQLSEFQRAIERQFGTSFRSYSELHQWTLDNPSEFWEHVWQHAGLIGKKLGQTTEAANNPWGLRWFPETKLNFAENLLRYRDDEIAMVGLLENGQRQEWSYRDLYAEVEALASAMRHHGIKTGDRVAGLLPNIPQTIIIMLATTSIGAIWSSCSPDFGANGAIDRFAQIEPRLLFTTDGYIYNEKSIDIADKVSEIDSKIDSIECVIVIPLLSTEPKISSKATNYNNFIKSQEVQPLVFESLPFDHPLYIMYSSGTTGTPKCIVHGAGGTLIQHVKEHQLHLDLKRADTLFYFTTCGWMMWNWLVSGLATGSTLILFDGSPFANDGSVLLDAIDREHISVFGTSAKYIAHLEKLGKRPADSHKLTSLRSILSTGSPLNHSSFGYVYREIKSDVHLASISGGTDIVSCFVLGNPNLPVHTGELQSAGLGMAVEFWNESGKTQVGEQGELVCTQPFPSTPVGFWNDDQDTKFRAAYFSDRPGIWTHGDFGEVTNQGGYIIHGRSDATLNPSGVRIGTAEIYRQIETLPEVTEGIVVGQNWQGDERVILFVVLSHDLTLGIELATKIKRTIRDNTTPRHVPAKIIQVTDIPRTMSGKIVELAVRDIIHGKKVTNKASLANPEALELFENLDELSN